MIKLRKEAGILFEVYNAGKKIFTIIQSIVFVSIDININLWIFLLN